MEEPDQRRKPKQAETSDKSPKVSGLQYAVELSEALKPEEETLHRPCPPALSAFRRAARGE